MVAAVAEAEGGRRDEVEAAEQPVDPAGRVEDPKPALAIPAPAKPPMRACDDEVGSPSHQVSRFQAMAPASPAKITASETTLESTVLPTVLATSVWDTK